MSRGKQVAALGAFARAQREESRRRLLDAARNVFEERGYLAPSVDDIAQSAGVSRQTFYRHFDGKLAIAMEYFEAQRITSMPMWSKLSAEQSRDPAAVRAWLSEMLHFYLARRNSLRTFLEMGIVEPTFLASARHIVPDLIETLGKNIPAFDLGPKDKPHDPDRWTDAWLLVYQIMEQCNNFAVGFGTISREPLIAALARNFVNFTRGPANSN